MRKKTLKRLALLLILTLIGTSATYAASDTSTVSVPSDVAGTTYEEAVKTLVEKDIITGDTDGLFHPDSNLTRAQACIIVVKSMDPPAADIMGTATQPVAKSGFKDMSGYGWAEGYISYAVKHGVTKGYPDGTFKPGNKVTMNELITMVLRAAAFTDENLGGSWPSNYVAKATEMELLANLPTPLPTLATKWMAAQIDYNALSKIEAANPPRETPGQGTDQDKPDAIPNVKAMTYVSGSFNSTMSTYNGKTISDDIIVYTFGEKKNYSSTMTFTSKISDYRLDTVFKYKNVNTPAFYQIEDGKIVTMVVPMDAGFSGRAYSVINGTVSTLNGSDVTVTALNTLTATKEITWLGEKGLTGIPAKAQYLQGELYELNLSDGEIQSIYKASDAGKKGDVFEEISSTGAVFVDVESIDNNIVKITAADGGALFNVKDNASVYILDQYDPTEYTTGRVSNIKAGVQIRAYDVSDDDDSSADVVVILK
ncbi:MAG TPA: S-layer homology domain-containing protein [Patescibacteria group bacterium]|nr:S-layer homology domain-containing protein [Patescibacteria group bacterium]